jgi:hypothetical protein
MGGPSHCTPNAGMEKPQTVLTDHPGSSFTVGFLIFIYLPSVNRVYIPSPPLSILHSPYGE